jgi:hypothetical protein
VAPRGDVDIEEDCAVQLRNGLLVVAVFAGLTASAFGQDSATLKWKFTKNQPFYQKMDTKTDQTMKVMGTDVKQVQSQTFYFKWTPQESTPDGGWTIEQQIVGVKMTIDIGGNKVEYDSTKDQPGANPLADFFKALVNSKFTLTVDKDGKVTKIDGRKEFVDNLAKANPQMKPLLDQILSDKALQEMAEPTFAVATLAGREVKKGDKSGTWDKSTTLDMGPIGSYKNSFTYTFEGKDEKDKNLDKVKVDTKLEYTPPKEGAAGNTLPFKIKSAELNSKNATGTILFNSEKGRIASSDTKLELTGKLQIEISGQTTNVELTQTQNTKTETTDEEPAELKKKAG